MSNLLVVTVSLLVSLTCASLCDLTALINKYDYEGRYFSSQRNNRCYVFALNEVSVKDAQNICRSIGGRLADVESQTNNYLQTLIANEKTNITGIDTEYWIGLLWNGDLKAFYWDTGAVRNLQVGQKNGCLVWNCACVVMTSSNLARDHCGYENPFICQLDLGCQNQEVINDSVCTPGCENYIKGRLSRPMTTPWTPPWTDSTARSEAAVDTTTDGNGTRHGNQDGGVVVADWQPSLAEYKKVVMVLVGVGGLAVALLVALLVMCALIVKYRRLLNDKDKPNRISMVDILHADSSFAARGQRPSDPSGSHPGSTSELLYNNMDNTYSTPDSDGGHAAEASDVFNQENGYSSPSDNAVRFNPKLDSAGSKYTQLNRAGDQIDQQLSHDVYGMESASEPQRDTRKISNTYEAYTDQH